jgi:imidazoleglycerol-phosphate dehydratase
MDHHHLIEDVGIALGKAIYDALGDKRGIERYGSMIVPLGDALVACSIDLSGRAYLNFQISSSICFSLASGPGSVPPYCAFRKRSVSA